MNDLDAFARLVGALAPWQTKLVLVGGWAHRMFRHHPLADRPLYQPLVTRDADVAFDVAARLEGDIKAALEEAGFKENLFGEHRPPVSRYTLGEEDAGFYAEFLTPLRGSGIKRSGVIDATVEIAGVTAQKLRHLDILFVCPWQITVGEQQGIPLPQPIRLQIANPTSFIVQKLLIHDDRRPDKQAQDVLYIHDTLALFGDHLQELNALWREHVQPFLHKNQERSIQKSLQENFLAITDTIRTAARIPQDRTLYPERMQAFCEQALEEVLGNLGAKS